MRVLFLHTSKAPTLIEEGGSNTQVRDSAHAQPRCKGLDLKLAIPFHVRQVLRDGDHRREHRHKGGDESPFPPAPPACEIACLEW
jgi:hypothetical protein